MTQGYVERELVKNHRSVLVFGGGEADRRAWAEEAAASFGLPLRVVETAALLAPAMRESAGVVFVPDVGRLGFSGQILLVQCLLGQEDRPKVVVGLHGRPDAARTSGALREDLHYALRLAQVDLDDPATRAAVKGRRLEQAARAKASLKAAPKAAPRAAQKAPAKPALKKATPKPAKKAVAKSGAKARPKPAARTARPAKKKARR